jgi:hypothetical protein
VKRSQIGISPQDAARQAREDRARIAFLADAEIAPDLAYAVLFDGTGPRTGAARMLRDEARRRAAGKLAALTLPGDEALFVLRSAGLTPGQASALLDRPASQPRRPRNDFPPAAVPGCWSPPPATAATRSAASEPATRHEAGRRP